MYKRRDGYLIWRHFHSKNSPQGPLTIACSHSTKGCAKKTQNLQANQMNIKWSKLTSVLCISTNDSALWWEKYDYMITISQHTWGNRAKSSTCWNKANVGSPCWEGTTIICLYNLAKCWRAVIFSKNFFEYEINFFYEYSFCFGKLYRIHCYSMLSYKGFTLLLNINLYFDLSLWHTLAC